jgi:hypothetical protein
MTAQQAKDKFQGKMIRVRFRNSWIVGTCDFIGINQFFNRKQVTVSRLPVNLKLFEEVELLTGDYNKERFVDGVQQTQ